MWDKLVEEEEEVEKYIMKFTINVRFKDSFNKLTI